MLFFDPGKKEQRFEYHPPQRKAVTKAITPPSQRAMDPSITSRPYHSVQERLPSTMKGRQIPPYVEREQSYKTGGFSGPAFGDTPIERALSTAETQEFKGYIGILFSIGSQFFLNLGVLPFLTIKCARNNPVQKGLGHTTPFSLTVLSKICRQPTLHSNGTPKLSPNSPSTPEHI